MTEYKERGAAIAEYIKQKIQGGKKSICDSCTHRNVCKAIDNQPCTECNHYQCTADVELVRHGRWIMGTGENGLQAGHRECSRCGEIVKYGYSLYGVHNFCNYCGAKMIEEEKE